LVKEGCREAAGGWFKKSQSLEHHAGAVSLRLTQDPRP